MNDYLNPPLIDQLENKLAEAKIGRDWALYNLSVARKDLDSARKEVIDLELKLERENERRSKTKAVG